MSAKWPKQLPAFTEEQKRMKDEFVHKWLEQFPQKYGAMEVFNHNYPAKSFNKRDRKRKGFWRVVVIGGGWEVTSLMRIWAVRSTLFLKFGRIY